MDKPAKRDRYEVRVGGKNSTLRRKGAFSASVFKH